jgi:hypothetical protein
MPAIELRGTPDDRLRVQAVMLFPNDSALRDQLLAIYRVRDEVRDLAGDQVISVSENVLKRLIEAPSYADMRIRATIAAKRAVIAADVLCVIYLMDKFTLPEPSMNKAVAVVQAYAPTATYGDGSRMDTSETQIRQYWQEFKPVAHLWAAMRINKAYPFTKDHKSMYTSDFESYLQVAQGFYRFGVSFIPKRAKSRVPIVDTGKSWTLPASILPKSLHSEWLPDRLIEILRNYKA